MHMHTHTHAHAHTHTHMHTRTHTHTHSRVHISEATLEYVKSDYEVEPGNGHERDSYLKAKQIKTYLIVEKVS